MIAKPSKASLVDVAREREMARAELTIPAFVVTGGASDDRN